jgi:hypothetical protein
MPREHASPHEVAFVGVAGLIGGVACTIGIGAIGITQTSGGTKVIPLSKPKKPR